MQTIDHHSSFTLLSEDLLVIPHFTEPSYGQGNVPEDESGALDVYQFDTQSSTYTEPTRIASFTLPFSKHPKFRATIYLRCAPTARTPATGAGAAPKVFDFAPNNRLICLDIAFTDLSETGPRTFTQALYVHSSALLDIIPSRRSQSTNRMVVPWVDWAEKTSWVDTGYLSKRNWFGQRVVGFDSKTFPFDPEVVILDFDQHRIKARYVSEMQGGWDLQTPGHQSSDDDSLKQLEDDVFCGRSNLAKRKYTKDKFSIVGSLSAKATIMIDDEHGECVRLNRLLPTDLFTSVILVIVETVMHLPIHGVKYFHPDHIST